MGMGWKGKTRCGDGVGDLLIPQGNQHGGLPSFLWPGQNASCPQTLGYHPHLNIREAPSPSPSPSLSTFCPTCDTCENIWATRMFVLKLRQVINIAMNHKEELRTTEYSQKEESRVGDCDDGGDCGGDDCDGNCNGDGDGDGDGNGDG